jgi:hypothetical protein
MTPRLDLDAIRKRCEAVMSAFPLELPGKAGGELWECPTCGGEGIIEDHITYYAAHASGIQVFGIGADLKVMEDFILNARTDIPALMALLDEVKVHLRNYLLEISSPFYILSFLLKNLRRLHLRN